MTFFYPSSPPSTTRWRFLLCCVLAFSSLMTYAERPALAINAGFYGIDEKPTADITISGRVTDATTNEALAGCNVVLKGTQKGTTTDASGNYKIVVPDGNSILVFGFIGFISQDVPVGNQTVINVSLKASASELSQVVVIGYGTTTKKDVTGSLKTIKSADFNRGIINSPEQLLQGKVAGVNVTSASGEPGGVQNITVRGPGGVRTGSTPLFVLDGIALDNSSTGGATNPLNFLNPQDIESIDVLKDASATAIYGARGANGVILITTKKGKAGATNLTLSSNIGISNMARPLPLFSADEYKKQVASIGGVVDDQKASTDWQREISRTAITQNHNLSFGGGADRLTYYGSIGVQDQQGILKNSSLKRYTARFNASQKFLEDRLVLDVNMTASQTINERPPIEGIIGAALSANPTYPSRDANGNPARYQAFTNPLLALDLNKDVTTINRVVASVSPSYKITKELVYKLNLGVDNSSSTRDQQL